MSLGICDAPAEVRLGRAPVGSRRKPRAPAPGEKQHHVQVHADGDGTSTPRTPRTSHPGTTSRHPAELLRNNRTSTSASAGSPYHRLRSHPPSSQDFNPSCRSFLFPFLSALLQAPSPRLALQVWASLEKPACPQGCCSPAPDVYSPFQPHLKYDQARLSSLSLCREGTADIHSTEQKLKHEDNLPLSLSALPQAANSAKAMLNFLARLGTGIHMDATS